MTLTPQDVRTKQFSTVKMRTGYDMDEVDAFLDEVESSIGSLLTDNDDLKARLAQEPVKPAAPVSASAADAKMSEATRKLEQATALAAEADRKMKDAEAVKQAADAKMTEAEAKIKEAETKLVEARRTATATQAAPASASAPAPAPVAAAAAAMAAAPAPAPQQDVPAKAFALLEAAQRTADETVAAAKADADKILSSAREEATKATGKLDEQRSALETKVNDLRAFERHYRTTLRETIAQQLTELDKVGTAEPKPIVN